MPVLVFPATRHSGVRLRLLSPQGSPARARFYCPSDDKELAPDEIVRGYELDDGSYILVEDSELEAVEPQKTREIALREFVDLAELPPPLLERGYYLTPQKDATKAYRLLAETMERTNRAGIATFVMRDREYLVAIFAQNGILCAETLRFGDELRDPAAIGLPEVVSAPRERVATFERAIERSRPGRYQAMRWPIWIPESCGHHRQEAARARIWSVRRTKPGRSIPKKQRTSIFWRRSG